MKRVMGILLLFAVVGCGPNGTKANRTSAPSYLRAGSAAAGLTRLINKPTVRICYTDASNSAQHRDDVEFAVLSWIEPLRSLTTDELATSVELTADGDCDASVMIGNYSVAYTEIGTHPVVHLSYTGWYGSRTVTLHEFGHAFGLLDTYMGRGGACQRGQPDSVMCWASYTTLQPDDVAGVRDVYQRVLSGQLKLADERSFTVQ